MFSNTPFIRLGTYDKLILRSLLCKPRTLYQIYQIIANIYRGYASVYCSNVYTLSKRLYDKGIIHPITDNPTESRRVFDLTDYGRALILEYINIECRVSNILPVDYNKDRHILPHP
jgi:DNA-binding PadR family transcriptional regulator